MESQTRSEQLLLIFQSLSQHDFKFCAGHAYLALIPAFGLLCLAVRITTGLRFWRQRGSATGSGLHVIPIVPYWIPWVGHGLSFAIGAVPYLQSVSRRMGHKCAAYGLWMGNTKHNFILAPSIAKQVITDRKAPVNMDAWTYYVHEQVFLDGGDLKAMHPHAVKGPIAQAVHNMVRETFVNKAVVAMVADVERMATDLISGKPPAEQSSWELSGRVRVLETNPRMRWEVSLNPLMRDFTSDIMARTLLGKGFMRKNPGVVKDIWALDDKIITFMAKTPAWMPIVREAAAARKRLLQGLAEFHDAYTRYLQGEDPGEGWGDMSDVSIVMHDRTLAWNASDATTTRRGNAAQMLSLFWVTNVNANQIIFWVVFYVFSDTVLLRQLREEIAPFVTRRTSAGGLQDPGKSLNIDVEGLWRSCPLLKGAVFETLRLEVGATSVKYVEDDFVLHESEEDAKFLGKDRPESFLVKKGEMIWVPHALHQLDEKYWPDPERFDARRFWEKEPVNTTHDDKMKPSSEVKVGYKTMKVWGGGEKMCKGKTFAEREICLVASAVIMCWEMEAVDGVWRHPGRTPGSSSSKPIRDFRVNIWKRDGW